MTAELEPRWITRQGLLVLHERTLALHGGAAGLRDEGLLESALARPANRYHYEGVRDLAALAATYLVGVCANHPFTDGNKRAGFLAAGLFLAKNGLRLEADQVDAALMVFAVAAGKRTVDQVADWLKGRLPT